uniref:Uncharacterized protein n=1 Tax=Glossina palpalis gambiensis TaxID=67801 RepID=A0A1B0BC79_9MUSC
MVSAATLQLISSLSIRILNSKKKLTSFYADDILFNKYADGRESSQALGRKGFISRRRSQRNVLVTLSQAVFHFEE